MCVMERVGSAGKSGLKRFLFCLKISVGQVSVFTINNISQNDLDDPEIKLIQITDNPKISKERLDISFMKFSVHESSEQG